jgi:putative addiction module component (TIGR02574 family)
MREAAKLSNVERAELLDELIRLEETSGVVLTPAQQEDLDRRIEEYEGGRATMISGEEAFKTTE